MNRTQRTLSDDDLGECDLVLCFDDDALEELLIKVFGVSSPVICARHDFVLPLANTYYASWQCDLDDRNSTIPAR